MSPLRQRVGRAERARHLPARGHGNTGQAAGSATPSAEQPKKRNEGTCCDEGISYSAATAAGCGEGYPCGGCECSSVSVSNRPTEGPKLMRRRRRSPLRSRCSRSRRSHANFRGSQNRNRFRPDYLQPELSDARNDQWQAPQYESIPLVSSGMARPGLYRSRTTRVELNRWRLLLLDNGYWYPAWVMILGPSIMLYDGPIYVGHRASRRTG